MFRNILLTALVAAIPACALAAPTPGGSASDDACVVTFHGYGDERDVEPPCRLDWTMPAIVDGDVSRAEFAQECDHYGGALAVGVVDGNWTCIGLDY